MFNMTPTCTTLKQYIMISALLLLLLDVLLVGANPLNIGLPKDTGHVIPQINQGNQTKNIDDFMTIVDEKTEERSGSDRHFLVRKSRHISFRSIPRFPRDVAAVELQDAAGVPYEEAPNDKINDKKKKKKRIFGTRKLNLSDATGYLHKPMVAQVAQIELLSFVNPELERCWRIDLLGCPYTGQLISKVIPLDIPYYFIGPFEVTEGDGAFNLTIARNCSICDFAGSVVVFVDPYTAIDSDASKTFSVDFVKITNLTVAFMAYETEKSVYIEIVDDDIPEAPEEFVVYAVAYDDIEQTGRHKLVTINDDDVVGCNETLGIERDLIKDHQFSASSIKNEKTPASNARLHHNSYWRNKEFTDNQRALQVDLLDVHRVSGFVIQGWGGYYVKEVTVRYENSVGTMQYITDDTGANKVFLANTHGKIAVVVYLDEPLDTRKIKLGGHLCTVNANNFDRPACSYRIELLGCKI